MQHEVTINGTVNDLIDVYTTLYNIEADNPQDAADFAVESLSDSQEIADWWESGSDSDPLDYDSLFLGNDTENSIKIGPYAFVTIPIEIKERVVKLNVD